MSGTFPGVPILWKSTCIPIALLVFPNGAPFTVDGKVHGKLRRYRFITFLPREKL